MERVGFPIDQEYLESARVGLKEYIKDTRLKLYTLAKTEFNIGATCSGQNHLGRGF